MKIQIGKKNFECSDRNLILEKKLGFYILKDESEGIEIRNRVFFAENYEFLGLHIEGKAVQGILQAGSSEVEESQNSLKLVFPSMVKKINVSVGDEFKKGDVLGVMEAMKMEMSMNAPFNGVVKSILVKVGSNLSPNQDWIEIEEKK